MRVCVCVCVLVGVGGGGGLFFWYWPFAYIFVGSLFSKLTIFGSIKILGIFGGIVRIEVRTC